MNDKTPSALPTPSSALKSRAKGIVRLDRRALLRAGAGSTPVLLTFVSSPVSAANSCLAASAFGSVATFTSRNPKSKAVNCASKTCEDWKSRCQSSSPPSMANDTVAATFGAKNPQYDSLRLRDVLNGPIQTSGDMGVLQHLTAMNLSLRTPFVVPIQGNVTTTYLRSIWSKYNGGTYTSGTGITWNSTQLVTWLRYQLNYSTP